jgi:spore coat protein CotH
MRCGTFLVTKPRVWIVFLAVLFALASCREEIEPYTPDTGQTGQSDTVRMFPDEFDYPDHLDYVFDDNALPQITLTFSVSEWNDLLAYFDENSMNEEYVRAKFTFNKAGEAETVDTVGVRLRGNTSRRRPEGSEGQLHQSSGADWHHAHFSVDFNKYDDAQRFHKLKKLDLKWFKDDPAYVREPLCYDLMLRCGIASEPLSAYCRLTIKVQGDVQAAYFGVYDMIEHLDKRFLKDRSGLFGDADGYLWKASYGATLKDPDASAGVEEICLDDSQSKRYIYSLKTNEDNIAAAKEELSDFIFSFNAKSGDEFVNWFESRCNVSFLLATYAVSVAVGHWDDYWNNCNNYYIYFNSAGKFFFIPYDLDNTLGTSLGMDSGSQDPLAWGDGDKNPLIAKLLTFSDYKKLYIKYLKALVNTENAFMDYDTAVQRIIAMQTFVSAYVDNDTSEDCTISDRPASWGNRSNYRLLSTDPDNNFFKVKASTIDAL